MDAYQTARAIVGFSDFLTTGSRYVLGRDTSLQTNVRGFSEGSLEIGVTLAAMAVTSLSSIGSSPERVLLDTVGEALRLFGMLKGQNPESMEHADNIVSVENIEGDSQIFQADTMNFVLSPEAGTAAEGFIRIPLQNGADSVRITHEELGVISQVEGEDAEYYRAFPSPGTKTEIEEVKPLRIDTINFGKGAKWRFNDQGFSFWAQIADERYRERVEGGTVRFGKGDVLVARVRTVQEERADGVIEMRYVITEIQAHRVAPEQGDLL